jgi:cytochrome c oxidase assembly protein subunit 15
MFATQTQNEKQLLDAKIKRQIAVWLCFVCVAIVGMVVIGGITRLTESGLSIVEWKPIKGILPPLDQQQWETEFSKYQESPQFKMINKGMNLAQFKEIFFWEYVHRLWGRLIGVFYLLPYLYFVLRYRISRTWIRRLNWGLVFGLSQGALGWYMVKSGLVDNPRVSHYRLTAHLVLALIIFVYLFWNFLSFAESANEEHSQERSQEDQGLISALLSKAPMHWGVKGLGVLVLLQISYGALVAGLRAGIGYNTFPKMGESWVPGEWALASQEGGKHLLLSFLENPILVQFAHRSLAWFLFGSAILFWILVERQNHSRRFVNAVRAFAFLVVLQFALGVATLLSFVAIPLASLHQLNACLVLGSWVLVLKWSSLSSGKSSNLQSGKVGLE